MKIGINATYLNDRPTGTGVFAKEITLALLQIHKELIFYSPVADHDIPSASLCRVPAAMKGSSRMANNLLRVFYLNTVFPLLCKKQGVEVLYCPLTEFPFVPIVPAVVHIHDLHPIYYPYEFGLGSERFRFSLKIVNAAAKRVVVSSDFVKGELLRTTHIGENKIDVVPLAYSSALFRPMPAEMRRDFFDRYRLKENYILFVASLFPYKNLKTLVDAFLQIKGRIPHSLVVVGRKDISPEPLSTDNRIIYMDYVPAEDLPFFYSYADVFVNPSLSEGFGIASLEAMACGTPVIASNRGSLPEVVGEAGILFEPLDSDHLGRLIMKVITNKGLLKELACKGLEHVKKFSWGKTAEGILASCEKALGKSRAS